MLTRTIVAASSILFLGACASLTKPPTAAEASSQDVYYRRDVHLSNECESPIAIADSVLRGLEFTTHVTTTAVETEVRKGPPRTRVNAKGLGGALSVISSAGKTATTRDEFKIKYEFVAPTKPKSARHATTVKYNAEGTLRGRKFKSGTSDNPFALGARNALRKSNTVNEDDFIEAYSPDISVVLTALRHRCGTTAGG